MDRKERFKAAFDHLKSLGKLHAQKDVAEKMESTPSNVSRALRGDDTVLTSNYCRRFAAAYDNIVSAEWLVSGKGEMLTRQEKIAAGGNSAEALQRIIDATQESNMLLRHQVTLVEQAAQRELTAKEETIAALKREVQRGDDTIQSLRRNEDGLRRQIDGLQRQVGSLQAQVESLLSQIAAMQSVATGKGEAVGYPFTTGVAEGQQQREAKK